MVQNVSEASSSADAAEHFMHNSEMYPESFRQGIFDMLDNGESSFTRIPKPNDLGAEQNKFRTVQDVLEMGSPDDVSFMGDNIEHYLSRNPQAIEENGLTGSATEVAEGIIDGSSYIEAGSSLANLMDFQLEALNRKTQGWKYPDMESLERAMDDGQFVEMFEAKLINQRPGMSAKEREEAISKTLTGEDIQYRHLYNKTLAEINNKPLVEPVNFQQFARAISITMKLGQL